jgi:phospholipid/cholesterol/gamma-HCH transport system substrate-binding protein
MLAAMQPDKLSMTLTAIAQGLDGRGRELGNTLVTLNAYLRNFTPLLPVLDSDIKLLAGLTKTYSQAAPAILAALNDFAVTGRTIATQRADYAAFLANLTSTSDDLRAFLDANSGNMIRLSTDSLPTLRILANYAPEFPCTLRGLAEFVPKINKVLGAGTTQPGLHARVVVVPSPGKYVPSKDTPIYGDNLGPRCYRVPFRGIALNDGTSAPHPATPVARHPAAHGTAASGNAPGPASGPVAALSSFRADNVAGSPGESDLVRELAGLSLGRRPSTLPAWSGLLVAPLFRGTEVIIR